MPDIFDVKIRVFTNDYNYKKNQALKFYRLSEKATDPDAKNTLQDKAEKWINKAELVLQKIEEIKLSQKLVLQKRNSLMKNELETIKPKSNNMNQNAIQNELKRIIKDNGNSLNIGNKKISTKNY